MYATDGEGHRVKIHLITDMLSKVRALILLDYKQPLFPAAGRASESNLQNLVNHTLFQSLVHSMAPLEKY